MVSVHFGVRVCAEIGMASSDRLDRFASKVRINQETGCWEWQAAKLTNGMGYFQRRYAHLFSYEHYIGQVPEGKTLRHKCGVKHCVNPQHMEVVDRAWRHAQQGKHNRDKTHCPKGHPYKNNTYKTKIGRMCATCAREKASEKYYESKRARARARRDVVNDG